MDINKRATTAIKSLLEERGISRSALAEKSAIPYATLSRKLNGGGELALSEVARIAKALDVTLGHIIGTEALIAKDAA